MLVCAFLCAHCTRDRGCSAPPAFPAPSDFRWCDVLENLARIGRRDRGGVPVSTPLSSPAKAGDPVFETRQRSSLEAAAYWIPPFPGRTTGGGAAQRPRSPDRWVTADQGFPLARPIRSDHPVVESDTNAQEWGMTETTDTAKRNIIICCDGTGNEISENISNVLKLYRCLRKTEQTEPRQLVFYDPGVGTLAGPDPWP